MSFRISLPDSQSALWVAVVSTILVVLPSCTALVPLMGEEWPPGYTGMEIPAVYRGRHNPFTPSDARTVTAGRELYHAFQVSCASCHGEDGRGDGPLASNLDLPPADFAAPPMLNAFRNHQDYVYWWVSEGVPPTQMPGWKDRMSETQRWQVITYAWYLGERAAKAALLQDDFRRTKVRLLALDVDVHLERKNALLTAQP